MEENTHGDKWYALFVSTGDEENVKERLEYKLKNQRLRILVPKRRLKERKNGQWQYKTRTLFPGYVLLNGCIGNVEYYSIKEVPGIIKLLRDQQGALEIGIDEISVVNRLICNSETIGCSNVYIEGGRIVVVDGPLLGMEGLIESIDKRKGRAKVRINLMNEARIVELSVSMVQPA